MKAGGWGLTGHVCAKPGGVDTVLIRPAKRAAAPRRSRGWQALRTWRRMPAPLRTERRSSRPAR